jgi:peptidoglycan/LPS O-acetylase OafA/YrhL
MQNNFHLIRFIAASLVLYGHCYPLTGRGNYDYLTTASQGVFPTSHMGVCIFFIVSGYLVSQSLQNSRNIYNFIWKRVVRIFPALIVVLLLCISVIGVICTTLSYKTYWESPETYRFLKLIKLYPYVQNSLPGVFEKNPEKAVNGSLWTLPYEVTMYAFLVILQLINFFKKRNLVLILFLLSFPISVYYIFNTSSLKLIPFIHLSFVDTLEFGIFFMAGTLMFLFKDKIQFRVAYFIIVTFLWFGLGFLHITSSMMIKIISFIALPYIVLYLANLKGRLNNFSKFGDFSYGIYIYAYPIQQMIVNFHTTNITILKLFLLSSLIVLPLSIISWYLVEERALRYKSLNII